MSEYIVDFGDDGKADVRMAMAMQHGAQVRGEIVRCRDCRHFTPKGTHKFKNGETNADYCAYIRGWMLQITPDGYCAWAERKEGE